MALGSLRIIKKEETIFCLFFCLEEIFRKIKKFIKIFMEYPIIKENVY